MDDEDLAEMKIRLETADIAYFERALALSTEHTVGFTPKTLTTVEAAWRNLDSIVATFGWIINLKDGRRLYLELATVDIEDQEDELTITALAAGQPYPELDEHAGAYWYRPDFLNEHLGIGSRALN